MGLMVEILSLNSEAAISEAEALSGDKKPACRNLSSIGSGFRLVSKVAAQVLVSF